MYKNLTPKFIIFFIFLLVFYAVYVLSSNHLDVKVNDCFTKNILKIKKNSASNEVVLVVIDNQSLDKISWPWKKDLFSDIFDYLENISSAKSVVFHNVVMIPDTYYPENDSIFYKRISGQEKLINSYFFLNSNMAGDVLPSEYYKIFESKTNIRISDQRKKPLPSLYKGIMKIPKEMLENSKNLAFSIIPEDNDEFVRSYMPVIQFRDKLYPSIALSAYSMYTGINSFVLYDNYLCSDDNCKILKIPVIQKTSKDYIGNNVNGVFAYYNWYSPISGYYTHKTYSAIDILVSYYDFKNGKKPKINPEEFENKIVVVGLNADKNVWEQLSETPIMDKQADIDVHATMINNMLSNTFKTVEKNNFTPVITILFCFFIIRGFRNFKNNIIFTTILSILYLFYYFYEYFCNIYVPPVTPVLSMYTAAVLKKIYSVVTTDKSSEMIKYAMGKYISKDVMKKVIENIDKLKLGGIRAVVTILFVDIRNFTQISEKLSPQEVSSILNEYFSIIEPIIGKYRGIVNKYIGDGVLAVFGEPIKNDYHALDAIKCGLEIIDSVSVLKKKLVLEGKPEIAVGIGINTGEVFAGNIGTEERLEYTVIGDNVNLASRIESYNKILKTQFLISEYTYEYVKDSVEVIKLSQMKIKGKSNPIDIYEILKVKDNDK